MGCFLFGCSSMLDITKFQVRWSNHPQGSTTESLWDDPMARVVPGDHQIKKSTSQPKSSNTGSLFEKHDGTTWKHIPKSFLGLLCHVFRETQILGVSHQPGTPKSLGKEAALRKFDYEQNQGAESWTFLSTWGLVQLFHLRPIFTPRNQIWDRIGAYISVWDDWISGDFGSKPGICRNHEHLWAIWERKGASWRWSVLWTGRWFTAGMVTFTMVCWEKCVLRRFKPGKTQVLQGLNRPIGVPLVIHLSGHHFILICLLAQWFYFRIFD